MNKGHILSTAFLGKPFNLLSVFSESFLPIFFLSPFTIYNRFLLLFYFFFSSIYPSTSSNSTKHLQVQLHSSSTYAVYILPSSDSCVLNIIEAIFYHGVKAWRTGLGLT